MSVPRLVGDIFYYKGDGPGVHGGVQDHAEEAFGVVQELVP